MKRVMYVAMFFLSLAFVIGAPTKIFSGFVEEKTLVETAVGNLTFIARQNVDQWNGSEQVKVNKTDVISTSGVFSVKQGACDFTNGIEICFYGIEERFNETDKRLMIMTNVGIFQARPEMDIIMTLSPAIAYVDENVELTTQVYNPTDNVPFDFELTDTIPAPVQILSSSCTWKGEKVNFKGSLNPKEKKMCVITLVSPDPFLLRLKPSAKMVGYGMAISKEASYAINFNDLPLRVMIKGDGAYGEESRLSINMTNKGSEPITVNGLTLHPPEGMQVEKVHYLLREMNDQIKWSGGILEPGKTVELFFTFVATTPLNLTLPYSLEYYLWTKRRQREYQAVIPVAYEGLELRQKLPTRVKEDHIITYRISAYNANALDEMRDVKAVIDSPFGQPEQISIEKIPPHETVVLLNGSTLLPKGEYRTSVHLSYLTPQGVKRQVQENNVFQVIAAPVNSSAPAVDSQDAVLAPRVSRNAIPQEKKENAYIPFLYFIFIISVTAMVARMLQIHR